MALSRMVSAHTCVWLRSSSWTTSYSQNPSDCTIHLAFLGGIYYELTMEMNDEEKQALVKSTPQDPSSNTANCPRSKILDILSISVHSPKTTVATVPPDTPSFVSARSDIDPNQEIANILLMLKYGDKTKG